MKQSGKAGFVGTYHFKHIRNGLVIAKWKESNLIPTEGLNYLLNAGLVNGTDVTVWYMGLGSAAYTPVAGDQASNIVARSTEITTYAGNRPAVNFAAASAGSTTSAASPANFTFNAGVATVTNAFIMSAATGSVGTLLSSLLLATPRTGFQSGDILQASYTMTAASV